MLNIILTVTAAGIGAILRDILTQKLKGKSKYFLQGTEAVNYIGAFLMGASIQMFALNGHMYLLMTTGFLAGLTTYSTFALDQFKLLEEKDLGGFLKYTFQTFFFGLVFFALGMILGDII